MNPTLKKLSTSTLSPNDIANLLQKHIGDGLIEYHCTAACEALQRIPNPRLRIPAWLLYRILGSDRNHCEIMQLVIKTLHEQQIKPSLF